MEFTVSTANLTRHASWIARVLPSRPVVPILAGIRIDAADNQITLNSTDYETWASAELDASTTVGRATVQPGHGLLRQTARAHSVHHR